MKLDPRWRQILARAWSVRLIVLAFVLTAAEFVLPFLDGAFPRGVLAGVGALVTAGAFVARLLAQKDVD